MEWWLGAEQGRQGRQPLVDRCRIVVRDVINAAATTLNCRRRGFRGVFNMEEGPPARSASDHGYTALADLTGHSRLEHTGTWAVKGSVAQYNTFWRPWRGYSVFKIADSFKRAAHPARGIGIKRRVLEFYVPPRAGEGQPQ